MSHLQLTDSMAGAPRAIESGGIRERHCRSYLLHALIGLFVVAAPIAFVTLHRAPLPEEALVVALTGWPESLLTQPSERVAR